MDLMFTAHSTRGAASSAAGMAGLSTQQILARTGWSLEDRHYYRPTAEVVDAGDFVMLRTCKEHADLPSALLIQPWIALIELPRQP